MRQVKSEAFTFHKAEWKNVSLPRAQQTGPSQAAAATVCSAPALGLFLGLRSVSPDSTRLGENLPAPPVAIAIPGPITEAGPAPPGTGVGTALGTGMFSALVFHHPLSSEPKSPGGVRCKPSLISRKQLRASCGRGNQAQHRGVHPIPIACLQWAEGVPRERL